MLLKRAPGVNFAKNVIYDNDITHWHINASVDQKKWNRIWCKIVPMWNTPTEDPRFTHIIKVCFIGVTLQWRDNEHDSVSNHGRLDCLLSSVFRRRSKKTSKLRVIGLCEGNPLIKGQWHSIRWRHHGAVMHYSLWQWINPEWYTANESHGYEYTQTGQNKSECTSYGLCFTLGWNRSILCLVSTRCL